LAKRIVDCRNQPKQVFKLIGAWPEDDDGQIQPGAVLLMGYSAISGD
jgi:hypothetical protein